MLNIYPVQVVQAGMQKSIFQCCLFIEKGVTIITSFHSLFTVDEALQSEKINGVMRKEFFILMTVVGVCEEIYVLSHPQDNLRLILPTMECENYLYASNVCQNRAKHTLVTNYSRQVNEFIESRVLYISTVNQFI